MRDPRVVADPDSIDPEDLPDPSLGAAPSSMDTD